MTDKQELVCSGCRKTLRIPRKFWGKKVRCPQCSNVLSVPAAPPVELLEAAEVEFIEDEDPFVDESPYADDDPYAGLPPVSAPPRRRSSSPKPKKKKKKSRSGDGGAFGAENRMLGAGVLGGLGLILLSVVWFVGGLFAGIIFYYPPILFIIGVVSIIKGLIGSD